MALMDWFTVTAQENRNVITIKGIRGQALAKILSKTYNTSRVAGYMFNRVGSSFISFNSCFAPDVYFTLKELMNSKDLSMPKKSIQGMITALEKDTWMRRLKLPTEKILHPEEIKQLDVTPLPHQQEFFDIYEQNTQLYGLRGYLLAAAPGAGKTLSAFMLAVQLQAERVIIVSPNNAINRVWESTVKLNFHEPQDYYVSDGTMPFRDAKYVIIHYEYLQKFLEHTGNYKNKKTVVILDESHNFNESKSARTNYFLQLCRETNTNNIVFLSGTPIKAAAAEAIPLLKAIDPLFNDDAEERFKKIYAGATNRATAILNNRLGLVSFKVSKDRLNLDAPVMTNVQVPFKGSEDFTLTEIKKAMAIYIEERLRYYKSIEKETKSTFDECMALHEKTLKTRDEVKKFNVYKDSLRSVIRNHDPFAVKDDMVFCNAYEKMNIIPSLPDQHKKRFKEVKSLIKYTHLVVRGQVLGNIVGRARIQCHVELARHIDYETIIESTVKKTVIFSNYVQVVDTAYETTKALGYKPLRVYGDTNSQLSSIVDKFFKDPDANPLIATYASLSTAVPLIAADTMIAIDVPFRQYIIDQAIARIHRLGATTQTNIYYTILDTGDEPNISTRTVDILAWSMSQVSDIIGIDSPYEITSKGGESSGELAISIEGIAIEDISFEPNDRLPGPVWRGW